MTDNKHHPSFYAPDLPTWRKWLKENHQAEQNVWLIFYKKATGKPTLKIGEAIDVALCFGWVDSKSNTRDEESYYTYFSKRNPKSNWSRVNKEKIARLEAAGLMEEAGLALVEEAKLNGCWTALDDVENLIVPDDLAAALDATPNAREHYEAFPRSAKRAILEWILSAKRPETRARRITKTAELAAQNIRANQ